MAAWDLSLKNTLNGNIIGVWNSDPTSDSRKSAIWISRRKHGLASSGNGWLSAAKQIPISILLQEEERGVTPRQSSDINIQSLRQHPLSSRRQPPRAAVGEVLWDRTGTTESPPKVHVMIYTTNAAGLFVRNCSEYQYGLLVNYW